MLRYHVNLTDLRWNKEKLEIEAFDVDENKGFMAIDYTILKG
jgi:hypothetical protein